MIYRPQLSCLAGLLVLATTTLASCITSRRNLHTPSILRHRLVLRVPSSSRCAQRRERRLCGVWVIFIRVRMTHTHRWTRRALHSRYGRVFSQEIYATFGYSNAGERIHDRHCSNRHRAGRFTHGNMRSKAAGDMQFLGVTTQMFARATHPNIPDDSSASKATGRVFEARGANRRTCRRFLAGGPVAALGLVRDCGRKRAGSGSGTWRAHACAALSQEKIRIGLCKVPAREEIQARRVTAHTFARVANRRFPDISFLHRTLFGIAEASQAVSDNPRVSGHSEGYAVADGSRELGRSPSGSDAGSVRVGRIVAHGWRRGRVPRECRGSGSSALSPTLSAS